MGLSISINDQAAFDVVIGVPGPVGPVGPQGPIGPQGPQGPQGIQGVKGDKGDKGDTGIQGPQGIAGSQGPQGPKGNTGDQGPQGPQGQQGLTGATGATGATGPQGPVGATGPQGPQGIQGINGDKYATTSTTSLSVSNGLKTLTVGTNLAYTTQQPVVIAYNASNHMHGVVSNYAALTGVLVVDVQNHTGSGTYAAWTVNLEGAAGIQGPQGPAGPAGATGPAGPTGPQGPQGIQGDTGSQGPVGPQGPQGDAGAEGPQGIQGPQGQQGVQGPQGAKGDKGDTGVIAANAPISYNSATKTVGISTTPSFDTISLGSGYGGVTQTQVFVGDGITTNYIDSAEGVVIQNGSVTFADSSVQSSAGISAATAASTYQTLSGMSSYLAKAGNLSGLTSPSTARSNLGLGSIAVVNDAPSNGTTYGRKDGAWVAAGVASKSVRLVYDASYTVNSSDFGNVVWMPVGQNGKVYLPAAPVGTQVSIFASYPNSKQIDSLNPNVQILTPAGYQLIKTNMVMITATCISNYYDQYVSWVLDNEYNMNNSWPPYGQTVFDGCVNSSDVDANGVNQSGYWFYLYQITDGFGGVITAASGNNINNCWYPSGYCLSLGPVTDGASGYYDDYGNPMYYWSYYSGEFADGAGSTYNNTVTRPYGSVISNTYRYGGSDAYFIATGDGGFTLQYV